MMESIKLLVVDDHPLFRRGLLSLLEDTPEFEIVGEAENAAQAIDMAERTHPDVILMDVIMPGSGIEATRVICQNMPQVKVLMLSASEENDYLFSAIDAGASGYLLKEGKPENLIDAIRQVNLGQSALSPAVAAKVLQRVRHEPAAPVPPPSPATTIPTVDPSGTVTPREVEIVRLLAQGLTNLEIAQQLELSENTIKNHVRNILRKTHVRNRAEVVVWAMQRGLINI